MGATMEPGDAIKPARRVMRRRPVAKIQRRLPRVGAPPLTVYTEVLPESTSPDTVPRRGRIRFFCFFRPSRARCVRATRRLARVSDTN